MIKLFLGSRYHIQHKDVTPQNAPELLAEDIRAKLLGSVDKFLYDSNSTLLHNDNISYVGGFYYEDGNTAYDIVNSELCQIQKADVIAICLLDVNAIATVTELLYAMMNNKRVILFVNDKLVGYDITQEYWFPILTTKYLSPKYDMTIIHVTNESEVIDYLQNLEETYLEGTDLIGKTTQINRLADTGKLVLDRFPEFSKCINLTDNLDTIMTNLDKLDWKGKVVYVLYTTDHLELTHRLRTCCDAYDENAIAYSEVYTKLALTYTHDNLVYLDVTHLDRGLVTSKILNEMARRKHVNNDYR